MRKDSFLRPMSPKVFMMIWTTGIAAFGFSGEEDATSCLISGIVPHVQEEKGTSCTVRVGAAAYLDGDYAGLDNDCLGDFLGAIDLPPRIEGIHTACLLETDPVAEAEPLKEGDQVTGSLPDPDIPAEVAAALREMARPYHPIIVEAAHRHEVDPALVKAIIMAESAYDPQAISIEGATGLMQLMPRTAEALGIEDAFNPAHNVDGGVRYLKQLLNEFNHDVGLALAAYNVGSGMVRRHQGIPPIKETQAYVQKVFAYYHFYKKDARPQADRV